MQTAIQVQGLEKRFGGFAAVNKIDFEAMQGEIFRLLGPNGAGKSTTISMLSCLPQPSVGDAVVMGHLIRHEPQDVKASISAVPQYIALYPDSRRAKTCCSGVGCAVCAMQPSPNGWTRS